MQQHHVGVLDANLIERIPDALVIVAIGAAGEGDTGTGGQRWVTMKSRLSMTEAVSARWLTLEPARGRQTEPVVAAKRSAA
jgi:hypothetical protein